MEKTIYFVLSDKWEKDEYTWFDTIEEAKEYIRVMLGDEDGSDAFHNTYYIYEGIPKMIAYIPPVEPVFEHL